MEEVIFDGVAREQFARGILGSRAAHTEPTLNTPMCQLRNGTRTETQKVLEDGVWKYCIALCMCHIVVYFTYLRSIRNPDME